MQGTFSVYILSGNNDRRYIGITTDIVNRLRQHNEGYSPATRGRGPWTVKWTSFDLSHHEALLLEKLLKKQKGGQGMQRLMERYARGS